MGGDLNTERHDLLDVPLDRIHTSAKDTILHSRSARLVSVKTDGTRSDQPFILAEFASASMEC